MRSRPSISGFCLSGFCLTGSLVGLVLVMALVTSPAQGSTDMSDREWPVEVIDKNLRSNLDMPWYAPQEGTLRPLRLRPSQEPLPPHDWIWQDGSKWQDIDFGWDADFAWLESLMEIAAWTLMGLLLAWLIYMLVRTYVGRESKLKDGQWGNTQLSDPGDGRRIENLPLVLPNENGDLLATAKRLYQEARFGEAMVYLFGYQLVQLDRRHMISLNKGKTNRQYLSEVRQRPRMVDVIKESMLVFEDFFFGNHTIPKQRFEACWNRLDEFHRQLGEDS